MNYVSRIIITLIIWIVAGIILRFSLMEYPGSVYYTYSVGEEIVRKRTIYNYTRTGSTIFDHDNQFSYAANIICGIIALPASGTEYLIVNKNFKIGSSEYSLFMSRLFTINQSEIISATTNDINHGIIYVELLGGKQIEIK